MLTENSVQVDTVELARNAIVPAAYSGSDANCNGFNKNDVFSRDTRLGPDGLPGVLSQAGGRCVYPGSGDWPRHVAGRCLGNVHRCLIGWASEDGGVFFEVDRSRLRRLCRSGLARAFRSSTGSGPSSPLRGDRSGADANDLARAAVDRVVRHVKRTIAADGHAARGRQHIGDQFGSRAVRCDTNQRARPVVGVERRE